MYVAPRPVYEDDPLFALRLAVLPVIGLAIGFATQSYMAVIYGVLMLSMAAGNRRIYDAGRLIGGPLMLVALLWIMSGVFGLFYQTPLALLVVVGLIYFVGFYLIQATGNGLGMLFIMAPALITVMGFGSYDAMAMMRNEMSKAALYVAVVLPFAYALIPVKTTEAFVQDPQPAAEEGRITRAAIRAVVMLGFSLFLYSFIDFSNVMLIVAGMYILVHSTPEAVWREFLNRGYAVLLGGAMAMLILALIMLNGHLSFLLALMFLSVLALGHKMMFGHKPPMVFQDAASIMISLVGGALSTSDPASAFIQRAGLTLMGAFAAALLVWVLDAVLVGAPQRKRVQAAQ